MLADPNKTYVVLVGVDKYGYGTDWDLSQAKTDIKNLALWFRGRHVPAANIFLFTNGTKDDWPPDISESRLDRPIRNEFKSVLANQLGGKEGGLLFVYWVGHGKLVDHDDELFLSNSNTQLCETIKTRELGDALETPLFQHYAQKILIVDACRAPYDTSARANDFHLGDFAPPRVTRIQSTPKAEKGTAGDFGPKFLTKLQGAPSDIWPPDFAALAKPLTAPIRPSSAWSTTKRITCRMAW
jgi:hypothetical protein